MPRITSSTSFTDHRRTTITTPEPDLRPYTNGHARSNDEEGAPLSKRRRLDESAFRRQRTDSPPWKRVVAEGPSSFTQNGIRKSGRTNQVPLNLRPSSEKRQTRRTVQRSNSMNVKYGSTAEEASILRPKHGPAPNHEKFRNYRKQRDTPSPHSPYGSTSSVKRSKRISALHADDASSKAMSVIPRRLALLNEQSFASAVATGRSELMQDFTQNGELSDTREIDFSFGASPISKLSRIKFRIRPAVLPLAHPGLVPDQARKFADLTNFMSEGSALPVEKGGLFHSDDGHPYSSESITRDARIMLRLEDAVETNGPLHIQSCSVYQLDEQEQPSERYGHQDHLIRAAVGLRKLMLGEQKKHQAVAKRLAEFCQEEWHKRQPKSSEELDAEKINVMVDRYRYVMRSLNATWDSVRAEINRQTTARMEVQEQARVRKALNNAVDVSTQRLRVRTVYSGSGMTTDDESSSTSYDEDLIVSEPDMDVNVSSSGSESGNDTSTLGALDDEILTIEQLRDKYAGFPDAITVRSTSSRPKHQIRVGMHLGKLGNYRDIGDESIDIAPDIGDKLEFGYGLHRRRYTDASHGSSPSDFLEISSHTEAKGLSQFKGREHFLVGRREQTVRDELTPKACANSALNSTSVASGRALQDLANGVQQATMTSTNNSEVRPKTTDTKPYSVESASSRELHPTHHQSSQSPPPQCPMPLKTPIPSLLRGTLREYQHYGLDWLAGLYANNTNGILADEMGLGKTIQTIALLAHLASEHHVWGPHLVIVPTSVMLNWEMEFKKWCPGFKILTYYGTQEERKRKRLGWRSEDVWNVCITSYQLVLQDQQVFKRRRWHYMILDEAHNIKNFQSQRWQTMLTFNTRARLLLTGTPLQNSLTELWSLLYFLMPSDGTEQGLGGFANLKEFQDWFKKPSEQILEHGRDEMDDESRALIGKLHKVLRPYLLRRLKADVERQMPAKYEHVVLCRLSKRQRELYDSFLNRADTRGVLASGNYLSIINCLMQLRKVCNHPDLFLDRPIMTSFSMKEAVAADYKITDVLIRRRLLATNPMTRASLNFLNLIPANLEDVAVALPDRSSFYTAQRLVIGMRESQRGRAQHAFTHLDSSTVQSNLRYLEHASRWGRFEELQHCVYLNALRRQQRPIFGRHLIRYLTLGSNGTTVGASTGLRFKTSESCPRLAAMVLSMSSRAESLRNQIQRFVCVTPAAVVHGMATFVLPPEVQDFCKTSSPFSQVDAFHESRMRLSIQFPDKRLLQYDCGKLQALDKLLRKLQAGGHRALIFTQMTKVLDILERFLNIHGHKYLRLDGATRVEQRQILTDRFNNDTRILAFILSSRSGGLGINLTGADTVIFYDLDWNPAMDKQCQDRCHRIGQTRDVHIHRLVSDHTIEANILRKANQKRMLDDVVIQEGDFTTDYLERLSGNSLFAEEDSLLHGDAAANAAMDRVLGGRQGGDEELKVFAQAEDKEDVIAANAAEREMDQTDAADFEEGMVTENATPLDPGTPVEMAGKGAATFPSSPVLLEDELNAWGDPMQTIDCYMLYRMTVELECISV